MKTLHQKIQELKDRTNGEFLTCRYVSQQQPSFGVREIKDDPYKNDPFVIWAYIAVWGLKDSYGTVAVRGCFAKSINERGPKSTAKNKIIHLYMHDKKEPVGQYLDMIEDDYGLRVAIKVDDVPGTPLRVLKQTKSGTINQYSYGFRYVWDKMEYDEARDAILMYECDLSEGSSVTIDASMPETYTIRSRQDFTKFLQGISEEAEEIISGLPKSRQMEVRQIVSKYKALVNAKPVIEEKPLVDLSYEPQSCVAVGGYKLDVKQFK